MVREKVFQSWKNQGNFRNFIPQNLWPPCVWSVQKDVILFSIIECLERNKDLVTEEDMKPLYDRTVQLYKHNVETAQSLKQVNYYPLIMHCGRDIVTLLLFCYSVSECIHQSYFDLANMIEAILLCDSSGVLAEMMNPIYEIHDH